MRRTFHYLLPMEQLLINHGYTALFTLSLLASTLLPVGSEWLLVTMILQQHNPLASVLVATAGNFLGACTCYLIGSLGSTLLVSRFLGSKDLDRVERMYSRFGSWSLLFSWLPVLGDPLCLLGGILRIPFVRFSLLVASGKTARYALVAWLTLQHL